MFYPIVDRRVADKDRRKIYDRRNNLVAVDEDRRSGGRRNDRDRRQINLDREKLLNNLRLPGCMDEESSLVKTLRLLLLPIVVAGVSYYVTFKVNIIQTENAKTIAESQIESAKLLADADRKHSQKLADAELETKKLDQIIKIFSDTIEDAASIKTDFDLQSLQQMISSLEIYEDQALPFLLRLKEYQGRDDKRKNIIIDAADLSLRNILSKSQLNITEMSFEGRENELLNLRNRKYAGYNLSDSKFIRVNLFGSDFSGATLGQVRFESSDLVNANFKGANLKDATFIKSDLKGVNFEGTYLDGTIFNGCQNIEFAKFSLNALLDPAKEPIHSIPVRKYIVILSHYTKELEDINKQIFKKKLNQVYDHLSVRDYDHMIEELKKFRKNPDEEERP